MDIIKMARELGKAIQQDEQVIKLNMLREKNDNDPQLQDLIGQFNLKRIELNSELGKPEKSNEKIAALDRDIKAIYTEVMGNENMLAYNDAKQEVDRMMNFVTQILSASVNGEDPDTVEEQSGCSGNCASCGGC